MSEHLRNDNECQNCGYTVELAFCTKCGQKNTETRQPFWRLFTHFVEDFTHYDGAFWKTIKHLLLRPGRLTREYLEGKRQTYVPPVKLYIFISFVTFFLMAVLPYDNNNAKVVKINGEEEFVKNDGINVGTDTDPTIYHTQKEYDSVQSMKPEIEKDDFAMYWINKARLNAYEHKMTFDDFMEGFISIIPKILFLYLPVFAFWLWLVHGKRRWYFFDHGIFTLHYFSFLLILITILNLLEWSMGCLVENESMDIVTNIIMFILTCYSFFYFFRSHSRLYGERRWISRLKGLILFFINAVCIVIALFSCLVYTMATIH